MRLATIVEDGRSSVAVIRDGRFLVVDPAETGLGSVRAIAAAGPDGRDQVHAWVVRQPDTAYRSLDEIEIGPAVTDPGAIYAIGLNYAPADEIPIDRPARPLVYAKLPSSVVGHDSTVTWDRSLTGNVDAEVELGVIIGEVAWSVEPRDAMRHVFGYTCINDISSRDPWLDGDQWLLGKSMPGFCPVGPWVVTADQVDPADLRLGCTINGVPIQDGSTRQMRFTIAEVIAYLSRHVRLLPGDLIATGTPARLAGPIEPDRHLQSGDVASVWIQDIGTLTTTIA